MTTSKQKNPVTTIVIDNFQGSLTRKLNGAMNSGLAKFTSSFGYDPFSKPGNLTWLEAPVDITGPINDLIVAAKPRFSASAQTVYAMGSSGNLYQIQPNSVSNPNLDSVIGIASVKAGSATYNFGSSLEFYGATEKIFVGADNGVNSINFDGTGETRIGTTGDYNVGFRPLVQFAGYLVFGNGKNIGLIDSTNTVVSSVVGGAYQQLSPSLPPESNATDLDVSIDGNYLNITASGISNESIATVAGDRQAAASSNGNVYSWNGTDKGVTAYKTIPSYAVTALQNYLDNKYFFSDDSFGASVSDGSSKILTLPDNKSPFANSTAVNGNFLTWIAPELVSNGTALAASMYYYGQLDQNSPKGLWRMFRYSTALTNGFVYQTPLNILTNNKYSTVNNAITSIITLGYGKHYFSTFEVNNTNTTVSATTAKLKRFLVTSSGTGTPQSGVYETQTQLFSKRMTLNEIRVYTEPTVSGNGFQLDVIGSSGSVVTNGSFTYTFVSGTDITLLQGALERINFNPGLTNLYACGIRITNTGSTNMTIKKIEVDWEEGGK